MRALIFTGDRNLDEKHDFTGAFRPESIAFAALHGVPNECIVRVPLDKGADAIRVKVEESIAAFPEPLDLVAFFCHGYRQGIQLGYRLAHCTRLATVLAAHSAPGLRVALYACSTAAAPSGAPSGNGGFADTLRDALCKAGRTDCQVDAHTTAAHATRNPHVMRFLGNGLAAGGDGGGWIVAPGSPLWKPWRTALQATSLRLRFPVMSIAHVHAELATMPGAGAVS